MDSECECDSFACSDYDDETSPHKITRKMERELLQDFHQLFPYITSSRDTDEGGQDADEGGSSQSRSNSRRHAW
jgi:hypothetical protein